MKKLLPFALVPLIILFFFDLKVLSSHDWNPKAFVLERPKDIPAAQNWGVGYDGRFSYALAVHPWGSVTDLDQPNFRYQRILYPLLVRVASGGQKSLVPWMMLAVNLIAASLGGALLGRLLIRRRVSPWWALVFFFSLGFLLTIRMDLLEPVTFALAFGGWLAYEEEKPGLAILLFALSGLTKEVGLLFPAALLLWEGSRREWKNALWLGVSFLPYLAWYVFLFFWLGTSEVAVAQSSPLLIPFSGVRFLKDPVSRAVVGIWVFAPAFVGGALALRSIWIHRRTEHGKEALLVFAYLALLAFMPWPTWEDPLAILRVGLGEMAAIILLLAGNYPRLLPYAAALWAPTGLILALVPGML